MKRISLLLLLVVLAAGSVLAQNKALSLDGDGDYVSIEKLDVVGGTGLTLSAWVKSSDFSGTDARFISKATGVSDQEHVFMLSERQGKSRLRLEPVGSRKSSLPVNFPWMSGHISLAPMMRRAER